jgi:glutamate--cysteine ligase catalytic subunit
MRREYMDPDLVVDEEIKQRLVEGGMDELLATHFAHLFIRDPLVVFAEDLQELDLSKSDHFENLQSTNWQHMRFKPPPPSNDIGWRVEFRSMEIQMTDFENAAFAVFIVLVTRAILSFDLNFYIPIPRTAENMETAHRRAAVTTERFYFRKDPFGHHHYHQHHRPGRGGNSSGTATPQGHSRPPTPLGPVEDEFTLMTVDEIINGQRHKADPNGTANVGGSREEGFPGLVPLVEIYLNSVNIDVETRCALARYLDLIRRRASGKLWTGAAWMRHFVRAHPEYKGDSVVTERMCYDLVKAVEAVTREDGQGDTAWQMF